MSSLSAIIITFNEAINIGRCIESILPVVDEIVVVDSFSTDATKAICEKYPLVRFIQREWEGYAPTKNWANQQARFPYILSLDADEALDEKLQQSILAVKKNGFEANYEVNRLTNYCGHWVKHCGWYPDKKVRLFKKESAVWEGDFVHETLRIKDGSTPQLLAGHLLHYSYYSTLDHKNRIEKYSTLHAQKMYASGKTTFPGKALFSALWKFKQVYSFKLGFLDGKAGFNIAWYSALAVFLKYQKLTQLYANKK